MKQQQQQTSLTRWFGHGGASKRDTQDQCPEHPTTQPGGSSPDCTVSVSTPGEDVAKYGSPAATVTSPNSQRLPTPDVGRKRVRSPAGFLSPGSCGGGSRRTKLNTSAEMEVALEAAIDDVPKRRRIASSKVLVESDDEADGGVTGTTKQVPQRRTTAVNPTGSTGSAQAVILEEVGKQLPTAKNFLPKREPTSNSGATGKVSPSGAGAVTPQNFVAESASKRLKPETKGARSPQDRLPLRDMKIVLTGVFDSMDRNQMTLHVQRLGGRCMSSVSSKTSILVFGSVLETGKPVESGNKYQRALQLQKGLHDDGSKAAAGKCAIQLMSETEFLKLYPPRSEMDACIAPTELSSRPADTRLQSVSQNDASTMRPERLQHSSPSVHASGVAPPMLWSEKWRPKSMTEIIGNGETVKKLFAWLRDWREVCVLGQVKEPPRAKGGRFGEPERINARACILSGSPGIGKTTAARVVAEACGYEIIEFNSSDDRGKSIIEVIADMTSGGKTLTSFFSKPGPPQSSPPRPPPAARSKLQPGGSPQNAVLIMDEVDGLSAGDRGGGAALINLIVKTQCPVICICNDRSHPKVRALVNKCYDLRFSKPPKNSIAKRICEIAARENIDIDYNAAELLCERVGNDLRQILNTLQLMGQTCRPRTLKPLAVVANGAPQLPTGGMCISFDSIRREIGSGIKDSQVMCNPFDTGRKLLAQSEAKSMSLMEKLDCFFVDYDLMPLFLQENYITAYLSRGTPKNGAGVQALADVADAFSYADVIGCKIRRAGAWSLLSEVGLYSVILPSTQCAGFVGRIEFPKILGKTSATSKNRRLLNELSLFLSPRTTTSGSQLRISGYLDLLYSRVMQPLLENDSAADPKALVSKSIALMDEYGLTKDQVIESIGGLRFKNQEKTYDLVNSTLKRTLTTAYNSTCHSIRMAPNKILDPKRKPLGSTTLPSSSEAVEDQPDSTAPIKDQSTAATSGSSPINETKGQDDKAAARSDDDEKEPEWLSKLFVSKTKRGRKPAAATAKASPKRASAKAKSQRK